MKLLNLNHCAEKIGEQANDIGKRDISANDY